MGKPTPADVAFWLLAAVAAAFFGVFVLVLGGVVPVDETEPGPQAEQVAPPETRPLRETGVEQAERRSTAATSTARAPKERAPQLVTVVVTAARGDCWLSARAGSENGRVLDERVLLQGESVRFRAPRVWLSLGAASNVDVLVDQEPREVPAGTVAVLLAPRSTT